MTDIAHFPRPGQNYPYVHTIEGTEMGDILYSERAPPTPVCESPSNTLHMDSFFAIKVLLRMFGFQKVIFLSRFVQMDIYPSWIPCYVLQQIITK